jgi:hypothetical protein
MASVTMYKSVASFSQRAAGLSTLIKTERNIQMSANSSGMINWDKFRKEQARTERLAKHAAPALPMSSRSTRYVRFLFKKNRDSVVQCIPMQPAKLRRI